DFAAAVAADEINNRMKAPGSLSHRYYVEDFGHGLLPFMAFATIARVAVPAAQSLFTLAESVVGTRYRETGRTAKAMGIAGMDMRGLISLVRNS
ncbi:MAG TPA: NAD/NADP octopine/nopaline dehydrogenase family protein, partial [Burkholderiales bacterium]